MIHASAWWFQNRKLARVSEDFFFFKKKNIKRNSTVISSLLLCCYNHGWLGCLGVQGNEGRDAITRPKGVEWQRPGFAMFTFWKCITSPQIECVWWKVIYPVWGVYSRCAMLGASTRRNKTKKKEKQYNNAWLTVLNSFLSGQFVL